ncbi:hypothetical protein LZ30DRAFT_47481 [Colletotrichum cereale]|nr:hypothetical protein LZ30DRAFT_47481 [Colletotrichum cereale]
MLSNQHERIRCVVSFQVAFYVMTLAFECSSQTIAQTVAFCRLRAVEDNHGALVELLLSSLWSRQRRFALLRGHVPVLEPRKITSLSCLSLDGDAVVGVVDVPAIGRASVMHGVQLRGCASATGPFAQHWPKELGPSYAVCSSTNQRVWDNNVEKAQLSTGLCRVARAHFASLTRSWTVR